MNEQYYTAEPTCASNPVPCDFTYRGHSLSFMTDAGVFSRGELDQGTRLLLDALPELSGDVLDLGCGWGAIGVSLARANPACRVVMADVNRRALELAKANLSRNGVSARCVESDGMAALSSLRFDAVVTNPPIRAGKQVVYGFFAQAHEKLLPGGALYVVIRKQQGAPSAIRYLSTLFAEVTTLEKDAGYWILRAVKAL